LPEIRDGGRTLVFKIKPGIYFTPDPAFNGKPRELVADDYVYSWKRLIDARMRSFWSFYLDGRLRRAIAMAIEEQQLDGPEFGDPELHRPLSLLLPTRSHPRNLLSMARSTSASSRTRSTSWN
jgi:hypothetical protein